MLLVYAKLLAYADGLVSFAQNAADQSKLQCMNNYWDEYLLAVEYKGELIKVQSHGFQKGRKTYNE